MQTCRFNSAYSLSGTLMRAASLESGPDVLASVTPIIKTVMDTTDQISSCSFLFNFFSHVNPEMWTKISASHSFAVVIPTTTTRCRRASKSNHGQ